MCSSGKKLQIFELFKSVYEDVHMNVSDSPENSMCNIQRWRGGRGGGDVTATHVSRARN